MFGFTGRYIYCTYYSFALISTIAFGDIIGKNYIEDVSESLNKELCYGSYYPFDHRGGVGHRTDVYYFQEEKNLIHLITVGYCLMQE